MMKTMLGVAAAVAAACALENASAPAPVRSKSRRENFAFKAISPLPSDHEGNVPETHQNVARSV
jgi:hypothetical protein